MMICEKLLIYRRWEVVRALGQSLKGDTTVGFAEMKIGCWRTVKLTACSSHLQVRDTGCRPGERQM